MNGTALVDYQLDPVGSHLGVKPPGIPMKDYLIGWPPVIPVSNYLD